MLRPFARVFACNADILVGNPPVGERPRELPEKCQRRRFAGTLAPPWRIISLFTGRTFGLNIQRQPWHESQALLSTALLLGADWNAGGCFSRLLLSGCKSRPSAPLRN